MEKIFKDLRVYTPLDLKWLNLLSLFFGLYLIIFFLNRFIIPQKFDTILIVISLLLLIFLITSLILMKKKKFSYFEDISNILVITETLIKISDGNNQIKEILEATDIESITRINKNKRNNINYYSFVEIELTKKNLEKIMIKRFTREFEEAIEIFAKNNNIQLLGKWD